MSVSVVHSRASEIHKKEDARRQKIQSDDSFVCPMGKKPESLFRSEKRVSIGRGSPRWKIVWSKWRTIVSIHVNCTLRRGRKSRVGGTWAEFAPWKAREYLDVRIRNARQNCIYNRPISHLQIRTARNKARSIQQALWTFYTQLCSSQLNLLLSIACC